MRLATVRCSRLAASFLCGVALGVGVATLDFRSSSAWLKESLQAALDLRLHDYEYDYEYEWSTLDVLDSGVPPSAQPAARLKPECNFTVADSIRRHVRVLCWVMTGPKNHATKAAAINATWGQHCDTLLFMSSKHDPTLPTVALNVSEGRKHLWSKTQAAFKYIVHKGLLENADWVIKADDDTFVVMENLRHLLQPLDASQAIFVGLRLRPYSPKGFMSGGAGYVLSRMAALRFVEKGLSGNLGGCRNPGYMGEDVAIGRCMMALNATFFDSRDSEGLERFHAYGPERQMVPDKNMDWLKKYSYYQLQPPSRCCSSMAVSFHYISPTAMRAIYYLVYRLKPYGLNECELPAS